MDKWVSNQRPRNIRQDRVPNLNARLLFRMVLTSVCTSCALLVERAQITHTHHMQNIKALQKDKCADLGWYCKWTGSNWEEVVEDTEIFLWAAHGKLRETPSSELANVNPGGLSGPSIKEFQYSPPSQVSIGDFCYRFHRIIPDRKLSLSRTDF